MRNSKRLSPFLVFVLLIHLTPYTRQDCPVGSETCYTSHYDAAFNMCSCCTYVGAVTSTYVCAYCFQENSLQPGPVTLKYYILDTDKQVCERVSEASGGGSYRSPTYFAAVSNADTINKLCTDTDCKKCESSPSLYCSTCNSPFRAINPVDFKSQYCYYDCSEAYDNTNPNGLGTFTPDGPDKLCGACNPTKNCFLCKFQNSPGCSVCPYSKTRYKAINSGTFADDTSNSNLDCSTFSARSSSLTLTYYISPNEAPPASIVTSGSVGKFSNILSIYADLADSKSINTYSELTISIYLLKTSGGVNQDHFIVHDTPLNSETTDWKGRLFQRVSATVNIEPFTDCTTLGISTNYCYTSSEKATIVFKTSAALFYVTKSMTLKKLILDGADLHNFSPLSYSRVCSISTDKEATCSPAIDTAANYDNHAKYSDFKGVFTFEFLVDYSSATIPSLTIEDCVVRNFFKHTRARTFISMRGEGGFLTLTRTTFSFNYFELGLISNLVQNQNIDSVTLNSQYTTTHKKTCNSYGRSYSGNCFSLTVTDCTFKKFNSKKYKIAFDPNSAGKVQGMFLSLTDFNGLIKISGSTFSYNLASVTQNREASPKFNCYPLRTDSTVNAFTNKDQNTWDDNIDIVATSRYKLNIDKHMRKVLSSKPRWISSLIYLRDFKNSLAIYNNDFSYNVASYGSILFVEGFENKNAANYYLIDNNKMRNNLAWGFGLTIVIMQISRDIISMQCTGFYIKSNSFENNIGCSSTFGNVIVSCDGSDLASSNAKTTFESGSGGDETLDTFYSKYNTVINLANESPSSAQDPLLKKISAFLLGKLPKFTETEGTFTHPFTGTTFGKYIFQFISNTCFQNYAIISNCIYVQGAYTVAISYNTFRSNSAPTKGQFQLYPYDTYHLSAGTDLLSYSNIDESMTVNPKKSIMKETSPIVIRQANTVTIKNCNFEENSAGFSGDYYFGAAITLHQIFGLGDILIDSCDFRKHVGLAGIIKDVYAPEHKYEYCSFPMISFNYWTQMTSNNDIKFTKKSTDTLFQLSKCNFYNNFFAIGAQMQDTPTTNKTRGSFNTILFNNQLSNPLEIKTKFSTIISAQTNLYATILHYFDENDERGNVGFTFDDPSVNLKNMISSLLVKVSECSVQGNQNLNGNPYFSPYWFNLTISKMKHIFNFIPEDSKLFLSQNNVFAHFLFNIAGPYASVATRGVFTIEDSEFSLNYGTLLYFYNVQGAKSSIILTNNQFNYHEVNKTAVIVCNALKSVTGKSWTSTNLRSKYGLLHVENVEAIIVDGLKVEYSTGEVSSAIYITKNPRPSTFRNVILNHNTIIQYFLTGISYANDIFQVRLTPPSAVVLQTALVTIEDLAAQNNTNIFTFGMQSTTLHILRGQISNYDVWQTDYPSFAWVPSSCILNITAAVFKNIMCRRCQGGVILGASATLIQLTNSTFLNISARTGGVILSNLSTLTIYGCSFLQNRADNSDSVIQMKIGTLQINNSLFYNNTSGDYAAISLATVTLKIINTTFQFNVAKNFVKNIYIKESETIEILHSTFIDANISQNTRSGHIFVIDTSMYITNTSFEGSNSSYGAILVQSDNKLLRLVDCRFFNNLASLEGGALYLSSNLELINTTFQNNSAKIISSKASHIFLSTAEYITVTNSSFFDFRKNSIYVEYVTSVIIAGSLFRGSQSPEVKEFGYNQVGLFCISCLQTKITESSFSLLYSEDSGGALFMDFTKIIGSVNPVVNILSNIFTFNTARRNGGAICLMFGDQQAPIIYLEKTNFTNNLALDSGGAIFYHSFNNKSNFTMRNSNISYNKAGSGGGLRFTGQIFYYDSSCFIYNNSAVKYGPNIASYGVMIRESSQVYVNDTKSTNSTQAYRLLEATSKNSSSSYSTKSILPELISTVLLQPPPNKQRLGNLSIQDKLSKSIVSGQTISPELVIELVDEFGQIVEDDTSTVLTISAGEKDIKLSGLSSYTANKGKYTLTSFSIIKTPNSMSKLVFDSTGIVKLQGRQFPQGFFPNSTWTIDVPIRECLSNERKTDVGQCVPCDPDQLNVYPTDDSKTCTGCTQASSVCKGGDLVGPKANFWRYSGYVDYFIECLNSESCAGTLLADNANENDYYCKQKSRENSKFCVTGWCLKGYSGNLCQNCIKDWAKSSDIYCVPCTNNPQYYGITALIILVAIAFIVFTIRKSLQKKKRTRDGHIYNKASIMLKILINYFQLVSIISSFNFQWPGEVKDTFEVQNKIAGSSAQIFSIDCVLKSSAGENNTMSVFFIKLAFIALSPLIFLVICFIVWVLIFLKRYGRKIFEHSKQFKTNLTVSIIVVLFLLHTTIVKNSIMAFRCQSLGIEDGETKYYMERDLEFPCWEGEHLKYSLVIALPSLLVWGFGTPLLAFIHIRRNLNNLQEDFFKDSFGFLYDGYKHSTYYWEFVILYRKIIMIFISVFMVTIKLEIQAICVLGVAFLSYILHTDYNPFLDRDLNDAEKRALISATFTIYTGLYFLAGLGTWASFILYVLIVIANVLFGLSWLRGFLREKIANFGESPLGQKLRAKFPTLERFAKKDNSKQVMPLVQENGPIVQEKGPTTTTKLNNEVTEEIQNLLKEPKRSIKPAESRGSKTGEESLPDLSKNIEPQEILETKTKKDDEELKFENVDEVI